MVNFERSRRQLAGKRAGRKGDPPGPDDWR